MNSRPSREEVGLRMRAQLESELSDEIVNSIVDRVMALLPTPEPADAGSPQQLLIHAYGRNQPGILAAITSVLAKHTCDIVDISLILRGGKFVLHLTINAPASLSVNELEEALGRPATELDIHASILANSSAGPAE